MFVGREDVQRQNQEDTMAITIASITIMGAVFWANSLHLRDDESRLRISVHDLAHLSRHNRNFPAC